MKAGFRRRTASIVLAGVLVVGLSAGGLLAFAQGTQDLPKPRIGATAPDIAFTTTDGKQRQLSDFRGKPVMLWLIATWCPTCQASAATLAENKAAIEKTGLVVVTLRLYKNLGYQGPTMAEFAKKWAPSLTGRNWFWGDADQRGSFIYDPRGYPDIYWLVRKDGTLAAVDTAPNVTIDNILAFGAGA